HVAKCKEHDKVVFLHLDLIKGFSRDAVSLKYLKETVKADGVISTKVTLLKEAKNEGFFIIQRLFMLDSTSFKNSIHAAKSLRPDIVELMPGIMPKIIARTCQEIQVPVIASGLIDEKEEVIICLKAGATSVSTTKQELWYV
ncbi:MAG: glycerol-3-phosphate responsive antiterminator, partial [Vallitaleaceae bacterium]|nr:glycerol-3-phosphate responsive antiterminator [Vallitaleaceae bacterium]